MYTHIHSIDWDFIPDYSTRTISYYEHKRNHEILAEYWTPDGYEYYYCSPEQMQTSNVGIYIGCQRKTDDKPLTHLVQDHEHETEFNISLNEEEYLK